MITKFNLFESTIKPNLNDPQPGDYVICTVNNNEKYNEKLTEFLKNNIGKVKYFYQGNPNYFYIIDYNNVFVDFNIDHSRLHKMGKNKYQYLCEVEQILVFSKNKEDLEHIVASIKYNI